MLPSKPRRRSFCQDFMPSKMPTALMSLRERDYSRNPLLHSTLIKTSTINNFNSGMLRSMLQSSIEANG
jgi:hypothetical protein